MPALSPFKQDLAFTGVVGRSDNAFIFHALHQSGSAIITDLQTALDIRCRGFAITQDKRHRLVIEIASGCAELTLIEDGLISFL
jgi:hypothetical protein